MVETQKEQLFPFSFRLAVNVAKKLNERIVADGYHLRSKSRWIIEAVEELLEVQNVVDLVGLSSELVEGENKQLSIRMPRRLILEIEQLALNVRKSFPAIEGVKSKIVRTAIMQKFLRN